MILMGLTACKDGAEYGDAIFLTGTLNVFPVRSFLIFHNLYSF